MIIVKLEGGHSNQLFQYATGRRLAHKLGVDLLMDIDWFARIVEGDTRRVYELGDYKFKQNFVRRDSFAPVESGRENLKIKLYKLTKGHLKPRVKNYREKNHLFDSKVLNLPDNTYLDGFWQNEKYFIDIRPLLLEELELKTTPSAKNSKLLKQINTSFSVSLHFRRGDYVTNQMTNKFHGVSPMEYYIKALDILTQKTGRHDFKLFIFSNDIAWCKQNLEFKYPMVFVEGNRKGSEDMRLMKYCKHNIMANSSFSWWGAWLNQNPHKVVVAPKNWFQDKKANSETDIVPEDWLRI